MKQVDQETAPRDDERGTPDLICLSHLRWDFVYQRPQHLLSRWAREGRVFFVEEPVFDQGPARLETRPHGENLTVVVPHLPEGLSESAAEVAQEHLVNRLLAEQGIRNHILWFYTPMAVAFTRQLQPELVVYDCMDELSLFKNAPSMLKSREGELFRWADLVFTGGASLYELKRGQHPNVHLFPSSIDARHFGQARVPAGDPADQAPIPHPRLGYFGVIDERMDLDLVNGVAAARPDWQLVFVGPVVKIDPATLPRRDNIHYLGFKSYQELPAYLAGWSAALLPFAHNDATRFVSPTKTPEYLAGGVPVISTSLRDVVRPYGEKGLVRIADGVADFVAAAQAALNLDGSRSPWLERVDEFLAQTSWDITWARMRHLIEFERARRQGPLHVAHRGRPVEMDFVATVE